ncbi:MAG: hypothetical protein FWH27_04410 [Planctomycetaceae bacterium]|nr:hypothetical protein [Planctomycetaceae bacterium]
MFNTKNKQLEKILLAGVVATSIMIGGCSDEDKRNAAILSDAIRSGIAQIEHSQSLYQRHDWKAEDYFDDPKVIALCQAIRKRDLALIDRLIGEGGDVNAKGKGNMTPLLWAFVQGRPWNQPPTPAQRNQPGFTEKWAAEEFDAVHLAIFTKLLEHGADPNVQPTTNFFGTDAQPGTPITETVVHLAFPYFEAVMKNGGNPHWVSKDDKQSTLVHLVVVSGTDSSKKLQLLIGAGADLNQRDDWGMTPLMRAVSYNSYDPAIMLVEAGADWEMIVPNTIRTVSYMLLDRQPAGVDESYQKLIEILEEKGADFDEARRDIKFELEKSETFVRTEIREKNKKELAQLIEKRHERYEQRQQLKKQQDAEK